MFPILYRDDHWVAIDKPSGLLVHRTPISRDRHFVLQQLRDQLGRRLYPVHRLDRATSGVLLLAFSPEAAAALSARFREGAVRKRYLAVTRGWPPEQGIIEHPVRDAEGRRHKPAITGYRRLDQVELPVAVDRYPTSRYALVEVEPRTGRHQQIRKHFKHIGYPLIGDTTWGKGTHNRFFRSRFGIHRLLLHAFSLSFAPPDGEQRITLTAPIDTQWQALFRELGWDPAPFAGPGGVARP